MVRRSLWFASVVSVSLVGCKPPRIELDPHLAANAPEQPAEGVTWAQFRKPVKFGAYTGTITKGGFTAEKKMKVGPYERNETRQKFEFTMTGGTPSAWTGACNYGEADQSVLFPISDEAAFVCTLVPQGASGWQLQLASEGGMYRSKTLKGTLTDGTTTLSVTMLHKLQGAMLPSDRPVGYELREAGGKAVAAVQIANPPIVWIDPSLPGELQTAIAAAAFGLLLSGNAVDDLNAPD
ncbi:MAG TPA: hypothetical protein VIK91_15880 [Nannocystis sp.]